jgi:hypothetical protein
MGKRWQRWMTLLRINGVVAAGEFTAHGKLVDYKAENGNATRDGSDERSVLRNGHPDVQHTGWRLRTTEQNELGTLVGPR